MKRKTYVLVISAQNAVKKRARAGFKFNADPRAVMVTIDRKLALMADSDLKVYKPKSDHYLRATGKEEMPQSIAKKMNDGLRKLHTTAIADPDYLRNEDSIRNELEMMGAEGMQEVADELKIKIGKDEKLEDALTAALMALESEPLEVEAADEEVEQVVEDDEAEDGEEEGEETGEEEISPEKVEARFKELDKMTPEELTEVLEGHGYEDEGDKAGKILAILTEEFGEEVEQLELPEVTEDEDTGAEDDEEGKTDDGKGTEEGEEEETAPVEPKTKKNAAEAKGKAPVKTKDKTAKKTK